ncbi:DNA-directed RNA polymerase subunit omega [Chroococcus sp. FPU101]|uniref:DNA-directed RNA polymerase subunit omega n=1 Tax=Chroococcus sp. FPU101 TaxID=1974212 RepID=UPI001A903AEA|nr:DNA-directed RNA polymerase subunit omega [Chroococcus sp. FPU101]GFE68488.1 probable DNA-directed RNA polymerase omega subunit [Chroococcus sp. FPU101]
MLKRFTINSSEMMYRTDRLMGATTNRYRIVVQVARRAKRCRLEDLENIDDPMMKPVIRAIVEMSDELTEPELLGD